MIIIQSGLKLSLSHDDIAGKYLWVLLNLHNSKAFKSIQKYSYFGVDLNQRWLKWHLSKDSFQVDIENKEGTEEDEETFEYHQAFYFNFPVDLIQYKDTSDLNEFM